MFPFKARAALLLAALAPVSLAVFGQTSSGEVNGSVADQAGAAISAATVKLINQSTAIETQATLNKEGRFTFVNIKPGIYVLAPGATPRQMQFGLRLTSKTVCKSA
jgi:hypothetical protein